MNSKPYVVSMDIYLILKRWALQRQLILPDYSFFKDLRDEWTLCAKRLFPSFEAISENELTLGIIDLVNHIDALPVSIDDVYFPTRPRIDITRKVDINLMNIGISHRANSPDLDQQFNAIQSLSTTEVTLVDDVIFSGNLMCEVITRLAAIHVKVVAVCAGIGIQKGVSQIKALGVPVYCVRTYEDVIDEVCERDFYPGVPKCGRLLCEIQNIGVPYIAPFGKPEIWASIPAEQAIQFSKFCLKRTIELFEAIQKSSGKILYTADLERQVIGVTDTSIPFIDLLTEIHLELSSTKKASYET